MRVAFTNLISAVFLVAFSNQTFAAETDGVDWQPWSPSLFERAHSEGRLVLLNMEAVWCHWCHVMDERTYADKTVRKLIADHYIAVRVDQAANPDLGVRYGDWGWPATIIFATNGDELGKYRGFIPPGAMAGELAAYWKDPTPGASILAQTEEPVSTTAFLTDDQSDRILKTYTDTYDEEFGAWGRVLKFIQADTLDYAMQRAREGDQEAERKARHTLDAARKLIDPVWGGVFQYSDSRDWSSLHFEKILTTQRDFLKLYSAGYTLFGDEAYKSTALAVYGYLVGFMLGPDGAFYTSQDADVVGGLDGVDFYGMDDAARRASGQMPTIDKALYARENGWVVSGLVALYNATGDASVLATARRAADWVVANRKIDGGGFAHGAADRGGPFLGDSLAMGRAALDIYMATGERRWLTVAVDAGDFIGENFRDDDAGFATSAQTAAGTGVFKEGFRNIEENIDLARFANLLSRVAGQPRFRAIAEHAMYYLTSDAIVGKRRFLTGILSADEELLIEPAHVTVIGAKTDAAAQELHAAARALPLAYMRLDWWDRAEGPLPNPDVEYPELDDAAVFACANQICSLPIRDKTELLDTVRGMMKTRVTQRQ